jgi:hypothetical protein
MIAYLLLSNSIDFNLRRSAAQTKVHVTYLMKTRSPADFPLIEAALADQ